MKRRIIILILVILIIGLIVVAIYVNRPAPIVDTTPPAVSITQPTDGATVSGLVTISFSATDDYTVVSYEIRIDKVLRANSSMYSWNTTLETNGPHSILCRAQDDSGNWGNASITVTVDNQEPVPPPPNSHVLKIMSYNIEESGVNPDWKNVVEEEDPDILILIETGTWDDNGNSTLNQVVSEFNSYFTDEAHYVGYCTQGISFSTDGEAILSRYPIVEFNQIRLVTLDNGSSYDVTHDFLEAVVRIGTDQVHIIGAHLKSSAGAENEYKRERETEGIINYMDALGEVPILYMGDLNSFSPDDTGPLAPSGDLGYGPLTMMLHPDDPVYGTYSSTQHTFIDVFRTLNPTDPGYTFGHQNPSYKSRIDFIIANSYFADKLLNSTTGDTPSAATGSDHYSVDAFLAWNGTIEPDTVPPAQVVGLTATPISMSQINLTWTPNVEQDLHHYNIFRNGTLLASTIHSFYSDTGLHPGTTYRYEVCAVDTSMNVGPCSDPAFATTEQAGNPDLVVINEFLPDPDTLYSREWIELYNPQPLDADLSGYYLDDILNGGSSPYRIPNGTIIPGWGFLVFNQSTTGVSLNNAGDTVNLLRPNGTTVVDSHTYSSSSNDVSIGRITDGNATWTTFTIPTPGSTNNATDTNAPFIVINEFLPNPNTRYSVEWVELYNPLDVAVNVGGYVLDDITSGGSSPYIIPSGSVIPAHGFLLLNESVTGLDLDDGGDTVNYIKFDGTTVIDSYTYSTADADISFGRVTDGNTTWISFIIPTPGSSNNVSGNNADSVVINEFLPTPNSTYTEEWIELYNPLDVAVNLSGYVLDDNVSSGSSPYVLPNDTIIPAHGFLLFNESQTGISLDDAGDIVNYLWPDGSTVVDSYAYSTSSNDESIGRITDGASEWTNFTDPTPGSSNNASSTPAESIVINEFLPDPDTLYTEEWIELYNPLDVSVDISGYILDDITTGGTSPYTIPAGSVIAAHGFLLFNQSTTGIALNNGGDTVNYLKPDGTTVIDSHSYSSSSNDVSIGRLNDGESTWTTFNSPTPGESNNGSTFFIARPTPFLTSDLAAHNIAFIAGIMVVVANAFAARTFVNENHKLICI